LKIRKFDLALAVLSGVLTALSFPKFNLSFFAWISLIPLLFIILNHKPRQSFLLGLTAGCAHYALLIYWIPSVPVHYGNITLWLSILIYVVFVVFLALFWAFFSLVLAKIHQSFPRTAYLLAPFLWVSFEYILTYFLTGFPWELLGYSQYKNLPLLQMAAVTGVYGLSLVIVFFQSMFLYSMKYRLKSPFFITLAVIIVLHGAGFWILKEGRGEGVSFKGAVIQGNVSSDIYWDKVSVDGRDDKKFIPEAPGLKLKGL